MLSTPLSPFFPTPRDGGEGVWCRTLDLDTNHPMSPRPSRLHPLVATLHPGPAFPGEKKKIIKDANSFIRLPPTRLGGVLLGTPAGKGLRHQLAFTEGGMRSRGEPSNQHGKGSAGAALPAHNTAVCTAAIFIHTASSYIYLECHRSLKSSG